jgi:hypothetical protein
MTTQGGTMRLRARFAWWAYNRIVGWLDAPEPTEEELEQAGCRAEAEERAFGEALMEAEHEGYWQGRMDADAAP